MRKSSEILLLAWLVILVFIGYLITGLVNSRKSTEQQLRGQALSYARLVEQHASATFDRANSALIEIADHLGTTDLTRPLTDARRQEIEQLLASHQMRTAGVATAFLVSADGRILATSSGVTPQTDVSDRSYFQILKRERRSGPLVTEEVYGRTSRALEEKVVRRIDLPDGGFGGMIGANLDLAGNFSDFYSTLSLGTNSSVLLRDAENHLLVRYP